jgi:hypothetical protein
MKIDEKVLQELAELNGLIITKCKDGEHGGYFDENGNRLNIKIEDIIYSPFLFDIGQIVKYNPDDVEYIADIEETDRFEVISREHKFINANNYSLKNTVTGLIHEMFEDMLQLE